MKYKRMNLKTPTFLCNRTKISTQIDRLLHEFLAVLGQ